MIFILFLIYLHPLVLLYFYIILLFVKHSAVECLIVGNLKIVLSYDLTLITRSVTNTLFVLLFLFLFFLLKGSYATSLSCSVFFSVSVSFSVAKIGNRFLFFV